MFSSGFLSLVVKTRDCLVKGLNKTSPKQQILDPSKVKKFADDNFKFDENGRKISKQVKNTVGRGEIAHYEQFSFSHSVFKRLVLQTRENQGLFGKGINLLLAN